MSAILFGDGKQIGKKNPQKKKINENTRGMSATLHHFFFKWRSRNDITFFSPEKINFLSYVKIYKTYFFLLFW